MGGISPPIAVATDSWGGGLGNRLGNSRGPIRTPPPEQGEPQEDKAGVVGHTCEAVTSSRLLATSREQVFTDAGARSE